MATEFPLNHALTEILRYINHFLPIKVKNNVGEEYEIKSIRAENIRFALNPPAIDSVLFSTDDFSLLTFDKENYTFILPKPISDSLSYAYGREKFSEDPYIQFSKLSYDIPRFFYNHRPESFASSFCACGTLKTADAVYENVVPVFFVWVNENVRFTAEVLPFLFNIGLAYSGNTSISPSVSPRQFATTLISDILYYYPTKLLYFRNGSTYLSKKINIYDAFSASEESIKFEPSPNGLMWPKSVDLGALYSVFGKIVFVNNPDEYERAVNSNFISLKDLIEHFDGDEIPPYTPPGGGDGGYGEQSNSSNVTGSFDGTPGPSIVENLPVGSSGSDIASSGMYTKYLCNNALLNLLAEFFWEDNIGIQALKAVLGNPIDSIISLTAYPFALETLVPTTPTTIYFGQYDSHFSAFSLTKSSFQIDWGTITIPFFWGSFLDYSPYTKIQLYLPWGVGFVSIDPNEVVPWSRKNSFKQSDFVNGTIRVVTNIELDKGACVHNVVGNNGRIIGSFGGVVGKQVPVTGSDNSARILAMMSAAISSSSAVGMAGGGSVAAGKNLAYGKGMTMAERAEGREMIGNYKSSVGGAIQSLSGGLASPPSYPRAGTFSDATNALGYQYPYLIISRPSQSVPQQYGRFMGYPSNIFHAHLGEVRGYTEVSSIHLDNISATANELDELESILKGGVLL